MKFTKIHYLGRKPFKDRATGYIWTPDEIKLVTEKVAVVLTKFVEFRRVTESQLAQVGSDGSVDTDLETLEGAATDSSTIDPDLEQAMLEALEVEQKAQQEHQSKENMLLMVEGMNKAALIEYAAKYDTELPSTKKTADLRADVVLLIEQFGVR